MTDFLSESLVVEPAKMLKPLARGYIHQLAFFVAICACAFLIGSSHGKLNLLASLIYSASLIGMFGISALYHVPTWDRKYYLLMRRIDHAAIFILIAGSATPMCLLTLPAPASERLLIAFWSMAFAGIFMATLWTSAPKWFRALFYVAMGWVGVIYFPEIKSVLSTNNFSLLVAGGVVYTLGALIYAFKRPNPFPRVFGYHEIFHVFVVAASACHFCMNYHLIVQ